MGAKQETGARGEEAAARHLRDRGWEVLDRNWRSGHGEVDLVVRRAGTLAFVEVKARTGGGCGHPLEAVTFRKRREVEGVARAWLRKRGGRSGPLSTVRFDAVGVEWGPGGEPRIEHVPDAWRVGE